MWNRSALVALILGGILGLGACSIPANNAFDPETPAEQQAQATLSGVVRGPEGALEAAEVVIGDETVTTGEDGAYEFELVPGEYAVSVAHPGHLRFAVALSLSAGEERVLDVTLDAIPQVEGDDVGRIFGVVQRAGQLGLPAAEQDHSAIVVEVVGTGVRAATGVDGAFDLFLAPGTYDLSISAAGHTAASVTGVAVTAGEATEAPGSPIVLSGIPGTVTGTVALEDGATPDGVAVDLVGGGSATTGADGAFSIGDVPAGTYLLNASKDGYEPFTFGFVTVEAGRETTLPQILLEVSRGAIIGRALLAGQADNSGIGIQLEGAGASAVTGVDGSFRLENVREGTFTLRAFKDGFVSATVNDVAVAANAETDVGDVTLAPQQGDFSINGGAIFTTDPVVTLELEGEGAVEMRVSEDQTFTDAGLGDTAFVTFDANPSFTLSSGDGPKTLFAQLKDAEGVESPLLVASITLDTTPPDVSFVINGDSAFTNALGISLSITASDVTSGVAARQISEDDVLDEGFLAFSSLENISLNAATPDGLVTIRVRVRDFAGNVSEIATDTITLDRVAPTLTTFSIDCAGQTNPAFCPNAIVSLHTESPDADVAAMAVSNQDGLPNAIFEPFQADRAHLLSPGEGARTVFLLLRDQAGNVSAQFSDDVTVDSVAPTFPSVVIASGAAAVNDRTVSLSLTATDPDPNTLQMRVAFDGVLDTEPVQAFAATLSGDLPAGDGEKSVAVVFIDPAGNLSEVARDTVVLDETAPTIDAFAIDGGAAFTNDGGGAVTLTQSASDATSGVVSIQVSNDANFNEPFVPFLGTLAHVLDAVATDGTKTVRIRVQDAAGNISAPATASIVLDTAAPTLTTFTIDCDGVTDADVCNSSVVTLSVASPDAVEMAVSNLAGLPDADFEPLATGVSHLLAPGDGTRTAFLLLRDAAGNVSAAFNDSITVDTTPPNLASLVINGGAAATNDPNVTVNLAASGATKMIVAMDGVLDTEGIEDFDPQITRPLLPAGDGTKTVIAVFLDDAGNQSVTVSDTIVLDTLAPQAPSITVNGGDAFTTSSTVTLGLNAVGATEMRIRTDGAFDTEPFVPFASSTAALLIGGDCPTGVTDCRQACAIFRDAAGNQSAEVCDGITLDGTPPTVPLILTPSQVTPTATGFTLLINAEPTDAFFGGYEMLGQLGSEATFSEVFATGTEFTLDLPASTETDPALAARTTLLRLRAFDQAGNRSAEATLSVTVDTVRPADPVPSVTSATVNADTFAIFFDASNTSNDDATFDHYEIATNGSAFTPTALQDGLIYTLTQGDGVGCAAATPCQNLLRVKAVDAAGNESGVVTVTVNEDSTPPTPPRLAPRGASITGLTARMALEETSRDNGADALTYEIIGGTLDTFTAVPAASTFTFTLDRRDFSHEICARGKDAAGNLSTADCVVIEQRSNILISGEGTDEENPAVFGDVALWSDRALGLVGFNLRSDERFILDGNGDFAFPDMESDGQEILAVWRGGGDGAVLMSIDVDDPNRDLSAPCLRSCAPELDEHASVGVGDDDVVIFGRKDGVRGIFHVPVSGCLNTSPAPIAACDAGETAGFPDPIATATRLTDPGRDLVFCGNGFSENLVRVKSGIVTWCEQGANGPEIHRFTLPAGPDEVLADNLTFPGRQPHSAVVTEDRIYWASGNELCFLPHASAAPGTPFDGCTGANLVDLGGEPVSRLTAGDGDRIGFIFGGAFLSQNAGIFDEAATEFVPITNDILEQTWVNTHRDRIIISDRQRFSQDIVYRELTEGTWVTVDPALQAKPATDGRFIAWLDATNGIQMRAYDTQADTEFDVTDPAEFVLVGDSFFGIGAGKVFFGLADLATGEADLFLQDLETGQRVGPIDSGVLSTAAMNHEGTRIAWVEFNDPDNGNQTVLKTAPVTGLTVGAIDVVDTGLQDPRRMAIGGDTLVFEDNGGGGGNSPIGCIDATVGVKHELEATGRGVGAARLDANGLIFAAWGGPDPLDSNDDQIKGCFLTCGNTLTCAEIVLGDGDGGEVEIPHVSNSGFVSYRSVTPSDGLGQIGVYDVLSDHRFRVETDFDVDGDSPPFDPWIHDDLLTWTSFDLGSSDIFQARLVR